MAAKGVELASAYVSLGAETRDIAKAIDKVFDDFGVQADKAGKEAGRKAGKGFQDEVKKRTRRAGQEAGNQFGSAFGSGVGSIGVTGWMSRLGSEAKSSGNRAGFLAGKAMGAGITAGVAVGAVGVSAAIAGIGFALNEGFKRLKTIDQAEFKLRALGKTTREIGAITKQVTEVVTGTPFALQDAYGAAVGAIGSGIESSDELQKYLKGIADAAAFGGTSFEEMALIFGQVMNKGKFQAEEMLQLNERQIPVQAWLQKALGKTGEEITKMSKDGKLNIQDLLTAVQTGAGGMAQKMGETIQGGIDNMRTAVAKVGASFLAPLFSGTEGSSAANSAIANLTNGLKDLGTWIDNNQATVIGFFGETAKAAITFAEAIALTAEWTARSLGWMVNAVGDTLGAMTKGFADFQRLMAYVPGTDADERRRTADELDRQAEGYFSAGDGLLDFANAAKDAQGPLQEMFWKIDEWKTGAQEASRETQLLKDGLGELFKKAEVSSGTTIIKAPTAAELNAIDDAVFRVEQIPKTQDFLVVPKTAEAEQALIAFRDKEAEKPVEVPAEADTKPAEDGVGEWRTDEQGNPVRVPVAPQLDAANTAMEGFVAQWSQAVISPQVATGPGFTSSNGMPGSLAGLPGVSSNPGNIDTHGALTPETQAVQDYLRNNLGFKGDIGGYRQPDGYNEHSSGKASDVMIGSLEEGYALLPNLLRRPGVQYILFDNKQWNPDGTSSTGISSPHTDHLHVKTFDEGGWLLPGQTLANNETGKPELILTQEQIAELAKRGADPTAVTHGQSQGAAPGPVDPAQRAADLGRTAGFIPLAAGNTSPVGEGGLSNFLDLGESFVHNLIDTGAQAASMAASAAAGAASGGAGAAAGPAASTAIQMGAEAAKRGVSWGYDMAGIWGEAIVEQLFPFGAPHWLGTNPMAFMPSQIPGEQPGQDPAALEAARQKTMDAAGRVNPGGTPQPAGDPASAGPAMSRGAAAIQQANPGAQSSSQPSSALDFLKLGVFDSGGMLQPNSAAINLSSRPEAVLTGAQWKAMQANAVNPGRKGNGESVHFHAEDMDGMFREYEKRRRREARTHSGRPF